MGDRGVRLRAASGLPRFVRSGDERHLDIISRAAGLYDEVIVAVLINITKRSLFTVKERIGMLREVTGGYGNVRFERFHGLLVDFCAANGISAIVKGLRACTPGQVRQETGGIMPGKARVPR